MLQVTILGEDLVDLVTIDQHVRLREAKLVVLVLVSEVQDLQDRLQNEYSLHLVFVVLIHLQGSLVDLNECAKLFVANFV